MSLSDIISWRWNLHWNEIYAHEFESPTYRKKKNWNKKKYMHFGLSILNKELSDMRAFLCELLWQWVKIGPSHSRVPMLWTIHFFLWLQVPLPTVKKNSLAGFTLKDHLYQCPNKLSEELIRCMAAIYCWVCNASITKSSAKVVLPRQSIGSDQDWSCRSTSMVEISRISTDGNQHLRASYGISSYRWEVKMLFGVILWSPDPLRLWPFFFFFCWMLLGFDLEISWTY